jgi:hypothetical protein
MNVKRKRLGLGRLRALAIGLGIVMPAKVLATTLDLSWDTCRSTALVRPASIPPDDVTLYATAIGQTEPHQAYEVWIAISSGEQEFPDAWRFDADGCQGTGRFNFSHVAPAACIKCCPSYQGASASVQIRSYGPAPEHLGLPPGTFVVMLANAYPSGGATPNTAVRFHLAAFFFDHQGTSVEGPGTPGVTCGDYERPLCFQAIASRCNWLRMDGTDVPFEIGRGELFFRDECRAVASEGSTWGQIKGQYRR